MSLASWQSAVIELVSHELASPDPRGDLADGEREWLRDAHLHPGTAAVRDVVRDGRWHRVGCSAPLTVVALDRCGRLDDVRAAYLAATFAPSAYAPAEGRQFLAFLAGGADDLLQVGAGDLHAAHLQTVVELERAVLAARASTWTTNIRASRPDDAVLPGVGGLVPTKFEAGALLRALVDGTPLPSPGSGRGAFLVAPGIEGGFREATVGEIQALHVIGAGCPVAEVAGLWPHDLIDLVTLTRLEAVGALVRQPPPVPTSIRPGPLTTSGRMA